MSHNLAFMRNVLLLSFCLLTLLGCNTQKKRTIQPIVCTTNIVGDLVQQLAPKSISVTTIMGPGVDPHIYKAKPQDIALLQQAPMVFYNGLHLEGKMAEILSRMQQNGTVISVASAIDKKMLIQAGNFQGGIDPHIWFDIDLWETCAYGVAYELQQRYPEKKDSIQQRLDAYVLELARTENELTTIFDAIPAENKKLVTAHDAFSYFSRKFNFDLITIQGLSTQADFSVKTLDSISTQMVDQKIPCAFFESSIPSKSIETLLQICEQKGLPARKGGTLYSDALGEAKGDAGTYTRMMLHNARQIAQCLMHHENSN